MASLVLGVAGTALGTSLFGGGISFLGATLTGAQIGGALGAYLGTEIDAALMPAVKRNGPRLTDITIQSATEGAPIPRVYGAMRLAGQLIWASRFKETTSQTRTGGKGASTPAVETTNYLYAVSFAVGLCAGPVTRIGRVWADGNLLDVSQYAMRFYRGDETQMPDPVIEEIEGSTPAYRGLCYVVFEDMPLADFGNRIPQLHFEVVRALSPDNPDALENRLTGVALIPGAGEFVYAPDIVTEDDQMGRTAPKNAHNAAGVSDLVASLDELQALAPNLESVSLVVGWFGDDLRAGSIAIRPGVEEAYRITYPETWSVAGVERVDAHVVSRIADRPAYGGTPSDDSVAAAIAEMKARGLRVTFYPFVFMDVPPDNALPDPYSDNAATGGQAAYPWRGRITPSPAAGFAGSVDQTAAAAAQINAFFNDTWGYRRMVLHYANLCAAAGGVDAFLIGSELVTLTRARSDTSTYPAVAALKALAAEVKAILPGAKIGYAADWTEYACHQTGNGGLRYPLDALWSDPAVDFVGIDNYMPLADWRDGDHRDAAEWGSIYDPAYLASNIRGGEGYDWYYASPADREAQTRIAITDGLGKPWVWRVKDVWNWWSNPHYERADNSESATPTAWVPQSKPIRFTELGCPAVDKGANQPNVFYDPKSSESFFPYYSSGARDDLIQRRFLEAHLAYWSDPANNPVSTVYGAPMLDAANLAVWCWDGRPYPFFPAREDVWGDAANYTTGHWLNGRLGAVTLADLASALCAEAKFASFDVGGLSGLVTGYAVAETASVRDQLAPLMTAFFFDGVESEGLIKFAMRGRASPTPFGEDDVVVSDDGFGFSFERAQETDLPVASRVLYIDTAEYGQAVAEARRLVTLSDRIATSALPLVMDQGEAVAIGERLLQDAWMMREHASFALPPSQIALDPTDEVVLEAGGRMRRLRLTGIDDAGERRIEAVATDPSIYESPGGAARSVQSVQSLSHPGRALLVFLDLPLLTDAQNPDAPLIAAYADPWPGAVAVLKSATGDGYTLDTAITRTAAIGTTTADFWSGPLWRWDRVNELRVKLIAGTLASAPDAAVFAGANALAVRNADGAWEIVQFANAELVAPQEWRLTKLLRGMRGTEPAMHNPVVAGARVVVLNVALAQLGLEAGEAPLPFHYIWGPQGLPLSDPAFQGAVLSFEPAGLVPPAPCHVRFAWNEGGDLSISWKRRDRAPAAARLLAAETPMSEAAERYDLEILKDGAVVRTFSAIPQHAQIYTAAQQAADFPAGMPNSLICKCYQLSSALGRGRAKTESLYVR